MEEEGDEGMKPVYFPKEEYSNVECEECGDPIPWKRLKVVNTKVCLGCMEELESKGKGTQRHKMAFDVKIHCGELEAINTSILRKGPKK